MEENIKQGNQTNPSEEWEATINIINKYLEEILFRIEWNYGDCRAPFVFPPTYKVIKQNDRSEYICTIKLEFSVDESLSFKTTNPSELPGIVMKDLSKRYSFAE